MCIVNLQLFCSKQMTLNKFTRGVAGWPPISGRLSMF